MLPRWLKPMLDEFGHRMMDGDRRSFRSTYLREQGVITTEQLRQAVVDGYVTPTSAWDGKDYSTEEYLRAGLHFAGESCFYRLTALGWMTGIALGVSFVAPRAEVVELGYTPGSKPGA